MTVEQNLIEHRLELLRQLESLCERQARLTEEWLAMIEAKLIQARAELAEVNAVLSAKWN